MGNQRSASLSHARNSKPPAVEIAPNAPRRACTFLAPALALALLLVVALRFAQPIEDGDLFWQMLYGSQMIEHGTLRTDHTLYSWTPARTDMIYCAWVGELLLLGCWKACGIAGIFALRYAVVLALLGMMALAARQLNLLRRPEVWLIILIAILASVAGTVPKPQLLSLLLWNFLVFCWFQVLRRIEDGRNPLPWIYAIPCLVLLWVNTHGAFMMAAPFVAIIAVWGALKFPRRQARHLLLAAVLCAVATTINPYGIRYPLQLIGVARNTGVTQPQVAWNMEYQRVWSATGQSLQLPELLVLMASGLMAVMFARRRGWLGIAVLFVAYVPLYLVFLRTTFFLPAIFGFGSLYQLRETLRRRWVAIGASLLFVFLAAREIEQAKFHPENNSWMGFDISYTQPVDEAEFVARGKFGPRLYNTYNAGGYLIWRLYPQHKDMVDARMFPFLSWFDELQLFMRTKDAREFQSFLDRHPADVAVVDFQEGQTWQSFLNAKGWQPAFYGPSAAVFVPSDGPPTWVESADSLRHLRNGASGVEPFKFARAVGDYPAAWMLLDQMKGPLGREVPDLTLQRLQAYRDGHTALREGDYNRAWERFTKSFEVSPIIGKDLTIMLLLKALRRPQITPEQAASIRAGLSHLASPD